VKLDVAVIGGGVIGVASAVELARRSAQVTVLQRDRIGHGCSYGNAGWLRPSQAVPLGAMLGIRLPVIGAKGYSMVLPGANPHPMRSIYLTERKVAPRAWRRVAGDRAPDGETQDGARHGPAAGAADGG
jgi:cation diffusion facilitator CzcD-associated flavoprotein CzcO